MTTRVLLIDDDARLHELLSDYLGQADCDLSYANSGAAGLLSLRDDSFDVVLLDVMMPGMDGLQTLQRIRKTKSIPVIMLTARGDEADRVVGLELGADDYVPKPFAPRELLARIRAVLRRASPGIEQTTLHAAGIEADLSSRATTVDGKIVELTGLEFDLLVAMLRRPGRVVPRASLLAAAGRGDTAVADRTVDVHISKLRKKLGDDPKRPRRIKTVRGVGYVLALEMR
ncbi:MAG: response regulator transcription factor [Myxococcota bacterium]